MVVPSAEIWEEIGDWSGLSVRIRNLYNQSKLETLEIVKKSWSARVTKLTREFFEDDKGKDKKGLNIFEKDNFIKCLDFAIELQLSSMRAILSENILLITQEFLPRLSVIEKYANQLDKVKKSKIINSICDLAKGALATDIYVDKVNIRIRIDHIKNAPQNLAKQAALGINKEQFTQACNKVYINLEKIVVDIFDELWRLIINNAIGQAMLFYNDFLEIQNRYQQETSEQRQAEKDWIENQLQELIQIKKGIDVILKR
jgi:hypothetical protein